MNHDRKHRVGRTIHNGLRSIISFLVLIMLGIPSVHADTIVLGVGMEGQLYRRILTLSQRWVTDWIPTPNVNGAVIGVAIQGDGKIIGIGSGDRKLYWRASLNSPWVKAFDDGGQVIGIDVMRDGTTILGVGTDGKLYTRTSLNSSWMSTPNVVGTVIRATASKDSDLIVGIGSGDRKLYSRASLNSPWVKAFDDGGQVIGVAWSAGDRLLVGIGLEYKLYSRFTLNSSWLKVTPDSYGQVQAIATTNSSICENPISIGSTIASTWIPRCDSTHRTGSYAQFYTFYVNTPKKIVIDLGSTVADAYLYLLGSVDSTWSIAGPIIREDNDSGSGDNAKIMTNTLPAGRYTIEATTYGANKTGTFNLTVQEAPPATGASVGVFRAGTWLLDANANGMWDACQEDGGQDLCLYKSFGRAGDMPASGNWDGGSRSYIGVLRSSTGEWLIDRNGNGRWDGCVADGCYSGFGAPGDLPVAGDWTGNGFAKIGVFRNGQWFLDNGNGQWDGCGTELCLSFGQAGDLPAAGNWDGGLKAGVGVFRAGTWYLDYNGNGKWDGCGIDRCYFNSFGQAGDLPAAGDWNGDGKTKVGVFRAGTWYLDYNGNGAWDGCGVDRCYVGSFGAPGDLPVAGRW